MYDAMTATLNGMDVLAQMEIKDGTLVLSRAVEPNEAMDFSLGFKSRDVLFGFWGTAALVLLPLFLFLASRLTKIAGGIGKMLAAQFILFGMVYPCAAGLGSAWQSLSLNVCALLLLAFTARLLARSIREKPAA